MQDVSWHVAGAGKQKLFCLVEVELCMFAVCGGETRTLVKGEFAERHERV